MNLGTTGWDGRVPLELRTPTIIIKFSFLPGPQNMGYTMSKDAKQIYNKPATDIMCPQRGYGQTRKYDSISRLYPKRTPVTSK